MIRQEPHARIHLVATLVVIILGFYLNVERLDWIVLLLCIGAVWTAEALNTAIERLADRITTEKDETIRQAKDVAAAAVLVIATISAIVGIIIFAGYLI